VQAAPRYSVTPVVTEEELSSLETDWNRLSEAAELPNVFMTFGWFRAWHQRLAQEDPRRRPNILVLRQGQEVMGISPFVLRTCSRFGFVVRKIEFVGNQADYHDFVLGGDAPGQIEAVARFLAQTSDEWDLVELTDLREAGGQIPRIESALARANLFHRILPEGLRCPYLPVDAPSSVIVSRLSRSARRMMDGLHTLRKKQHRLERLSAEGLRVRILENPLDEPGLLEKLIALERQKSVHGELSQPFIAKYPQVFQSLFDTLGPRGWFCIALMELGERPVGWHLVFRCGKKLWDFLTAYDHSFSRLSPGTMLVSALIDYGFSHGYDEFDFLRGAESYKMQWTTSLHQTHRLLIWNRRWVSRARTFVYCDLKAPIYRLLGKRV
jgi:CelD/BcsL family acetyltransferase involved in cellulose biosynthesis